jgi:hypothetical protein
MMGNIRGKALGDHPFMIRWRVSYLVNASVSECRVCLPYEKSIDVLQAVLKMSEAKSEKTRPKLIRSRIRQLKKAEE